MATSVFSEAERCGAQSNLPESTVIGYACSLRRNHLGMHETHLLHDLENKIIYAWGTPTKNQVIPEAEPDESDDICKAKVRFWAATQLRGFNHDIYYRCSLPSDHSYTDTGRRAFRTFYHVSEITGPGETAQFIFGYNTKRQGM